MSLGRSLRLVLSPPHPAGRPFIIGGVAVALVGGGILGAWLFWLGTIFTLFCLYFFRDPRRIRPEREQLVLAPADGHIVSVMPAVPPEELGLGPASRWRGGVFLRGVGVDRERGAAGGPGARLAHPPR